MFSVFLIVDGGDATYDSDYLSRLEGSADAASTSHDELLKRL